MNLLSGSWKGDSCQGGCVFKFLFLETLKGFRMSQLVQTPSKGCAESVKDALFCMWLKIHPRLECVHQLSIQPCTLTPLASLCLPVRGSGGWQVNPWPSPSALPLLPPLSRALFHSHAATHHPPLLFFILSHLSKSTVFLLTLLLSQVQGLAGRLHWSGNLCLVS